MAQLLRELEWRKMSHVLRRRDSQATAQKHSQNSKHTTRGILEIIQKDTSLKLPCYSKLTLK